MDISIALAGNPNCGKTTLFNALTGSNQFVGNWPGVTVEKKEGRLKGHKDVIITDLPGIYSMSPYTLEEVVARNYLIDEKPDAILNIIDGTNLERNLYLTTQLLELGIPVVLAINMMDLVDKNGDIIYSKNLEEAMGVPVVEISALKENGILDAAEIAIKEARVGKKMKPRHRFSGSVEHAFAHIEELTLHDIEDENLQRWYSIKLFERDEKIQQRLKLNQQIIDHMEHDIRECEEELDDDAESIITSERYDYIGTIVDKCIKKAKRDMTISDKIDHIVTNRFLALPIFALVMFLVYYIAQVTLGTWTTEFMNNQLMGTKGWNFLGIDGLFVPGLHTAMGSWLTAIGCAPWLIGLINDGILAGVGAVIGFVPQMLVLFFLLGILEACGYMSRVAFIMDRIFRKFGLSGKSFIPILIGTGCGVPGVMASRTIENEKDRRMTIMTTTFIPCGAKMPIVWLVAGAVFHNNALVAVSAYFAGMAAIVCSGLILKKTKMFAGDPSPFVMELPAYHLPTMKNLLRGTWERGWSFIKKAGTIILISSVAIWFLMRFGFDSHGLKMLPVDAADQSILAMIGKLIAPIFIPLGWGKWQYTVATISGLLAKENVVATFGVLFHSTKAAFSSSVSAYSFLIFNLLCAPCFAAMAAIRREMNSRKWFWFAIGYQCLLAYLTALCIYQFAGLVEKATDFGIDTVIALAVVGVFFYLLFRRNPNQADRQGKE